MSIEVNEKNGADLSNDGSSNGVCAVTKEFHEDAIVARYGEDGMTYFTGQFTESGEGIFSKNLNKALNHCRATSMGNHNHFVSSS